MLTGETNMFGFLALALFSAYKQKNELRRGHGRRAHLHPEPLLLVAFGEDLKGIRIGGDDAWPRTRGGVRGPQRDDVRPPSRTFSRKIKIAFVPLALAQSILLRNFARLGHGAMRRGERGEGEIFSYLLFRQG